MKNNKANVHWGDIFYCDLGANKGSVQSGMRPVIIVQTERLNKKSPTAVVAKVLGIPRGTANDLMNNGHVEFIRVNGYRRIFRESFEKWYESQDKYKKVMEIEEAEGFVD